jgi:hypothetical protein
MEKKKYNGDDLYRINQEIKNYGKSHKGLLNDDETSELGSMLNERAKAISDCLGVEVHSICEDDDK